MASTSAQKKTAPAVKDAKKRGRTRAAVPAAVPAPVPPPAAPARPWWSVLFSLLARIRRIPRQAWGCLLILLTLCVIFGWRGSDAIFIRWITVQIRGLFGYGYLIAPICMPGAAMILLFHKGKHAWRRAGCMLLLMPLLGVLAHLFFYVPPAEDVVQKGGFSMGPENLMGSLWRSGLRVESGGVLSGMVAQAGETFFSKPVMAILFFAFFLASFVVALRPKTNALGLRAPAGGGDNPDWEHPRIHVTPKSDPVPRRRVGRQQFDFPLDDDPPSAVPPDEPPAGEPDAASVPPDPAPPSAVPDPEAAPKPRRASAAARTAAAVREGLAERLSSSYRFPPIKLLRENRAHGVADSGADLFKNAARLENTLASFGVAATPSGSPVQGPSVTRYEFTLEQGVKLSKLTNLSDDIALALGATGVRIAPIPSRNSVVGVEVPNRQVTPVLIRDVVESREFAAHKSPAAFAVGKDIGGQIIVGSIEELPHVLIAGTTGSGKSVCMNSLIISMLYKATPDQVRFIMVDPKMVELAPYNGIPHLLIPVVTDPRKAAGALQWAVVEMMRRYRTFSERGVKNLAGYNQQVRDQQNGEPLPIVVVVVDELADLMMAAAKEVEESIVRIAQMGRAAGIHLVISTQRPSADVITGLMKANIPSRIAFAVASSMESRIILDTTGAEKLVGRGDMLYAPLGEARTRVQGCYISPPEIERVVAFVKQTSEAQYDNGVMESIDAAVKSGNKEARSAGNPDPPEPEPETDAMLSAAVDVVMETGQASVSMLQRRLKLGYSRAARLVDQMEELGYVGPFEGSRPRQLLITREQWQEIKKKGA